MPRLSKCFHFRVLFRFFIFSFSPALVFIKTKRFRVEGLGGWKSFYDTRKWICWNWKFSYLAICRGEKRRRAQRELLAKIYFLIYFRRIHFITRQEGFFSSHPRPWRDEILTLYGEWLIKLFLPAAICLINNSQKLSTRVTGGRNSRFLFSRSEQSQPGDVARVNIFKYFTFITRWGLSLRSAHRSRYNCSDSSLCDELQD